MRRFNLALWPDASANRRSFYGSEGLGHQQPEQVSGLWSGTSPWLPGQGQKENRNKARVQFQRGSEAEASIHTGRLKVRLRAARGQGTHSALGGGQNAEATCRSRSHASPFGRLWCYALSSEGSSLETSWVWMYMNLHSNFNGFFIPAAYRTLFPWLKLEKQKDCLLIGRLDLLTVQRTWRVHTLLNFFNWAVGAAEDPVSVWTGMNRAPELPSWLQGTWLPQYLPSRLRYRRGLQLLSIGSRAILLRPKGR